MTPQFLIINLGLKSVRAIIFDAKGRKLAASSAPVHTHLTHHFVEQSPVEWWTKTNEVVRQALYSLSRPHVDFVAVTCSSSCLVPVDAEGRALGRVIMVSDRRAIKESETIQGHLLNGASHSRSLASNMLSKALWLKENEPVRYKSARRLLAPNDFLNLALTGELATDPLNAEKFLYDHRTGFYPRELLGRLDIDPELLPPVHPMGKILGPLKRDIQEAWGLESPPKVVLATYDALCGFLGSGGFDEGEASDTSGTITSFRAFTRKNVPETLDRIYCQTFASHGFKLVGGSNNLGGGLVEWARQCFFNDSQNPYETMEREAREVGHRADGLLFLPFLLGERAPLWDPEARGAFLGLERAHGRPHMARAILESTGFSLRILAEEISRSGVAIRRVRISGGLARMKLISEIKADILGKEVYVLEDYETTSLGAFFVAAISAGVFPDLSAAARQCTRIREVILPNLDRHGQYSAWFKLFEDTYRAMRPLYARRRELLESAYAEHYECVENL